MGVTNKDLGRMHEKASKKKDGVYTQTPYIYAVKGKSLVLVANWYTGEIWAVAGAFLVDRGTHEKSKLKQLMKNSI